MAAEVRDGVVDYLARTSRDFAQSLEESDRSDDIEVRVHDAGTGPFAALPDKLKRVYLSKGTGA